MGVWSLGGRNIPKEELKAQKKQRTDTRRMRKTILQKERRQRNRVVRHIKSLPKAKLIKLLVYLYDERDPILNGLLEL